MTKWFDYFPVDYGDVVIDLGAFIGEATFFFSQKVGKAGVVIALEPEIWNFRRLMDKLIHYKLSNVVPLFMAIGKETGRTYLNLGGENAHSTVLTGSRLLFGKRIVPVISWDDLVDTLTLRSVELAKVNVEGAEIQFLEGMTKMFPDKMVIDEHSRFGIDRNQLLRLLDEKGYRVVHQKENLVYAERLPERKDEGGTWLKLPDKKEYKVVH